MLLLGSSAYSASWRLPELGDSFLDSLPGFVVPSLKGSKPQASGRTWSETFRPNGMVCIRSVLLESNSRGVEVRQRYLTLAAMNHEKQSSLHWASLLSVLSLCCLFSSQEYSMYSASRYPGNLLPILSEFFSMKETPLMALGLVRH